MNILMVVCILITSQEHFYVTERARIMQESSLEFVQMDCEHTTASNKHDDLSDF